VRGSLVVNSTTALLSAARAGLGLAWLFRPSVEEDLEAGSLASVLDRYAIETPGYFLYYPRANARIEALRVFIDFMRERSAAPQKRRPA
jgi:DNA-binding transcriptional LysR family regulator